VTATEELASDAVRFGARIQRAVALAFQWTLSEAFMHANGVARPQGWLSAPAAIEVAKESGQTADTIVAANVLKMHARRLLTPGAQWEWLTTSTAIPALLDLQTATGNPLFKQGDGREGEPEGAMLGLPVRVTEHCPVLGDAGDLQLVSLPNYYAPRRQDGIESESSIHVYFDYVLQAYRFMVRTNGQPILSAPVAPARGTDTLSHFISLGARA
jgi:HK97 family phage major capsid protein